MKIVASAKSRRIKSGDSVIRKNGLNENLILFLQRLQRNFKNMLSKKFMKHNYCLQKFQIVISTQVNGLSFFF